MDLDNLQTATAKAVARLMSFAQITCFVLGLSCSRLFTHSLRAVSRMRLTCKQMRIDCQR